MIISDDVAVISDNIMIGSDQGGAETDMMYKPLTWIGQKMAKIKPRI